MLKFKSTKCVLNNRNYLQGKIFFFYSISFALIVALNFVDGLFNTVLLFVFCCFFVVFFAKD